jgi:hypothetical protein
LKNEFLDSGILKSRNPGTRRRTAHANPAALASGLVIMAITTNLLT